MACRGGRPRGIGWPTIRPTSGTRRTACRETFRSRAPTSRAASDVRHGRLRYGSIACSADARHRRSAPCRPGLGSVPGFGSRTHHNQPTYYTATNRNQRPSRRQVGLGRQLALPIKNIPTGVGDNIKVQARPTPRVLPVTSFQSLVPTNFAMYGGSRQRRVLTERRPCWRCPMPCFGNRCAARADDLVWFPWCFQPQLGSLLDSSIYGAYAAMSYNGNATAQICAGSSAAAASNFGGPGAGFACNPDFNVAQIGSRTALDPGQEPDLLG